MIKILINGYLGKMGKAVEVAVNSSDNFKLVAGVDVNVPSAQESDEVFKNFSDIPKQKLNEVDCVVDFSNSAGLSSIAEQAIPKTLCLVSGSTGYDDKTEKRIRELSNSFNVGVALCSNFSTGAVLLNHLGSIASRFYDHIELVESHHEKKIDAPSGTAISIAKAISDSKEKGFKNIKSEINKIKGTRGGLSSGINIHSLRLPGVIAKHELIFGAPGEILSFIHDSTDRSSFMPGVLKAVEYVMKNRNFVVGLDKILDL